MTSARGLREFSRGAPAGAGPNLARPRAKLSHRSRSRAGRDAGTRVQIIATPASGEGRALSTARNVQRALAAAGYGADLQTFNDLESLVRWTEVCDGGFSHLLCVGGDTTQSAAARAALRRAVPLVPVPTGFGNVFARAFGHRAAPNAVLTLIEHGEICAIDVGRAGDDLFLAHRSYGPLQDIEASVENGRDQLRPRLLRSLAYYLVAGRYLCGTALPSIRVEVDGALVSDDASMVTVANVETYRGFLSLTPAAVPTDGLFDIFLMPRTDKMQFWIRLLKLWLRTAGCWEGIALRRGRRVSVGINGARPEEMRVLPGALRVLVPAGSLDRLTARRPVRQVPAPLSPAAGFTSRLDRASGARARTPAGRPRVLPPTRQGRVPARRSVGRAAPS